MGATRPWRVVFPEGDDPRIIAAARRLCDAGTVEPLLIGERETILATAHSTGTGIDGLRTVAPDDPDVLDACAAHYEARRGGARPGMAMRAVRKPLFMAACLTALGQVDAMVAGIAHPTRRVIEAAQLCIGLAPGIALPSSFFLATFADRAPMLFADCALNVDPDAIELAHIAAATWDSACALLQEPSRMALLSFSTHGSASHPRVDKVREALVRLRELRPEAVADGELQVDAAMSARVAAAKLAEPGPVAGQANVLIFPDLDSGNIAYKLTQYLGGAAMTGPMLQGFAAPVADLSRGASSDDVVRVTLLLQQMQVG